MKSEFDHWMNEREGWTKPKHKTSSPFSHSFRKSASRREVADFTRQLAAMIQARMPLTRSLEILIKQHRNRRFKAILSDILESIRKGRSLSDSVGVYPSLFGDFYKNMIQVGEVSGNLSGVLIQLSTYLEKMVGLRRKIYTAMTYPSVIVFVAIGAISFLVFGVMPTFADMFQDFDAQMPLPARILMGVAQFSESYGGWILVGVILLIFIFRSWFHTESGKYSLDVLKIRMPLFGAVLKKIFIARFTRTLGTLLSSGVSLMDALDVTAKSVENRVIENEVHRIKSSSSRGETIEASLESSKIFPPLVVQMIAVGEETAELADMLNRTAVYYEDEVDAAIEALTSIIEPVIIVILGVILGGTMISIYLQIFDVMNVIQ